MEIRSVTLFCEPDLPPARTAAFTSAARAAFDFPLQSLRLAAPPFPAWLQEDGDPLPRVESLAAVWRDAGINYASLGPVQLHHEDRWLPLIPDLLAVTDMLFATVAVANEREISPRRCLAAAGIIRALSRRGTRGFGNLYFAALANCGPGAPFFPVAYHRGGPPAFAIAVQGADLAREALSAAAGLEEARANLVAAIEAHAAALTAQAEALSAEQAIPFAGIDFSLAPFPTDEESLAGALEDVGLSELGTPGSVFAAAFVAEAIARADFRRCGFSGVMLPVLEDNVLARRAGTGHVAVSDLLTYAAVCGVGLDTIPLPGDIDRDTLAGILLDVAALAVRLGKPLTARLMPLPGLAAGDPVEFDFPYFADGHVMDVPRGGLRRSAAGDLPFAPYAKRR